jgi:NAD(P)-dependent dehydrogenase (short-subunit alcohol dehydrogenase family)
VVATNAEQNRDRLLLDTKRAIVTGGASGIGRAIVDLFAQEGAEVLLVDRDEEGVANTTAAISSAGGSVSGMVIDVTDADDVERMLDSANAGGPVHVLVCAAGVVAHGTVVDTSPAEWRRIIDVNLTGVFLCTRAVIPSMIAAGGGAIITISSSTGPQLVIGNAAAYVASKAGVAALTRAIAVDHAVQGIRANSIAPGPTDTAMLRGLLEEGARSRFGETLPIGRLGTPEEIAAVALFLASEAASFVTGAVVPVDGGQTATVAMNG